MGWVWGLGGSSESESCSVMYNSLQPHGLHSPRNSPGQNTGVVAIPFSRVEKVRALKKKIHHIGRSDDNYFVANK